eukprot:Trichotokara_eunicae@DN9660_c0_g1_i1.p1
MEPGAEAHLRALQALREIAEGRQKFDDEGGLTLFKDEAPPSLIQQNVVSSSRLSSGARSQTGGRVSNTSWVGEKTGKEVDVWGGLKKAVFGAMGGKEEDTGGGQNASAASMDVKSTEIESLLLDMKIH